MTDNLDFLKKLRKKVGSLYQPFQIGDAVRNNCGDIGSLIGIHYNTKDRIFSYHVIREEGDFEARAINFEFELATEGRPIRTSELKHAYLRKVPCNDGDLSYRLLVENFPARGAFPVTYIWE